MTEMTGEMVMRKWTTVNGVFYTPNNDEILNRELYVKGGWELGIVEYLRDRCFPDGVGTFIDVGAHMGMITIPIAKAHPKVVCHAFEPSPLNWVFLTQNIAANDVGKNVIVHQAAVSDECGQIEMAMPPDNTVDNRIVVGHERDAGKYLEEQRQKVSVERTTLDMALGDLGLTGPIVMKMDVQGHELHVLRGMKKFQPEILIMEYWPYGLARQGATQTDLLVELSRYSHGAPVLGIDTIVRQGLHLEIIRALPWGSTNATEIICAGPEGPCSA